MSWANELLDVYEKNCNHEKMLPICHSTANAQIEITIDEHGNFVRADKVPKEEAKTIIPVSEKSAGRTSGRVPHPYADKLVYIAGDYKKYCDGKDSDNTSCFEDYIEQLDRWVTSEYTHEAVQAVLAYVKKQSVMHDIISCGIFILNGEGKLEKNIKIEGEIKQEDSFVRFRIVYEDDDKEERTWEDKTLQQSFIEYDLSLERGKGLCNITGEILPIAETHLSKIRNAGDKCKLISANDESNFYYRGRFESKGQAVSISYLCSQKIHNALKWLIDQQSFKLKTVRKIEAGTAVIIIWENAMKELPNVTEEFVFENDGCKASTYPIYKEKLRRSILGYKNELDRGSKAIIMGLDSANGSKGRLAICIYSKLESSDFLDNVEKWHDETAWFFYNKVKSFSVKTIVDCAFGTEYKDRIECKNSKMGSDYVCKLIPCITEGRKVPKSIVRALVNRASNPQKYNNQNNYQTVLSIACAMIRREKLENKEECYMALDTKCTDRSYLYGRLIAVADFAESDTYNQGEKRTTNAKKYFSAFSNKPCTTWEIIHQKLSPYLEKHSKEKGTNYYEYLINKITDMFEREDFADNSKLDPIYLHAYSCQMQELYNGHKPNTTTDNEEE